MANPMSFSGKSKNDLKCVKIDMTQFLKIALFTLFFHLERSKLHQNV